MADKAILFDSSRCSACQACVAACKGRFGLAPSASDSSSENETARAFGRAAVLDEEALENVAIELVATEVYEEEGMDPEEVQNSLIALVELAQLAESQGQTLFVWIRLLQD